MQKLEKTTAKRLVPGIPDVRWLDSDMDWMNAGLTHVSGTIWKDRDGKFWFNDEIQTSVCGPYRSIEAALQGAVVYRATL